jgi:hypothetical protein
MEALQGKKREKFKFREQPNIVESCTLYQITDDATRVLQNINRMHA